MGEGHVPVELVEGRLFFALWHAVCVPFRWQNVCRTVCLEPRDLTAAKEIMDISRKAEASWEGNFTSGHGFVSTQSRTLVERTISFKQRSDESGDSDSTNPEELIAAAAASCFAMALSKTLQDDSVIAEEILVHAEVTLSLRDEGPRLTSMNMKVEALLPTFNEEQLQAAVAKTAENCPVLRLLQPGFESVDFTSVLRK